MNILENNLKLPWYLKPFKGMIRNKLSDFIKKLAKDAIELIQKKFEEKKDETEFKVEL